MRLSCEAVAQGLVSSKCSVSVDRCKDRRDKRGLVNILTLCPFSARVVLSEYFHYPHGPVLQMEKNYALAQGHIGHK